MEFVFQQKTLLKKMNGEISKSPFWMEKIICRYMFKKNTQINSQKKHLNGEKSLWRCLKKKQNTSEKHVNGEISIQNGDFSILNGENSL